MFCLPIFLNVSFEINNSVLEGNGDTIIMCKPLDSFIFFVIKTTPVSNLIIEKHLKYIVIIYTLDAQK